MKYLLKVRILVVSGVRTYGMLSMDSLGTREIRQVSTECG